MRELDQWGWPVDMDRYGKMPELPPPMPKAKLKHLKDLILLEMVRKVH